MNHKLLHVTTISEPSFNGHRVVRLALEYDTPVDAKSLNADAYEVTGRTVTGIFCADQRDASEPDGGNRYVILTLYPWEDAAKTVQPIRPREPHPEGEETPPPMDPRGPRGLVSKREPLQAEVKQTADIQAADGTIIEKTDAFVSDQEFNRYSDLFEVRYLEGKAYNLFIPEKYDPAHKYPLVLFIGDQSISGKSTDTRITLEQGNGPMVWVKEEFQQKHPCFVLAPAHDEEDPVTNDLYTFTDQLGRIKRMCDAVAQEYSIDRKKIYTTGQSMGCMTSYELMYQFPEFFRAALCVSGHWDREKIATIARRGQTIWTIMSEEDDKGYGCICEVREMLNKEGIDYGWYEWDALNSFEELGKCAQEAINENHTFRVSIYKGDSALHKGMYDEVGHGHPAGWSITYRIPEVVEWLISQ